MKIKGQQAYDYIVFWASCAAYCLLALYICAAYLPGSVLHFKYATPHIMATIYPEKWDYYTGPGTGSVCRMYELRGNTLIRTDVHPFTGRFLFGLKRDGKVISAEQDEIIADTVFMAGATKYTVSMPLNGNLGHFLRADTLKYNNYHSENVRYLKGPLLLTIEQAPTWQECRKLPGMPRTITVIPINLVSGK